MKRLLLVCSLIVAISGSVMAEIVKINGLYFSLGTTTAQVVKDQSSDMSVYKAYTTVTIPASVTYSNYTYPVTSLGTSAFESCSNLQSVTLPASITTINTDAFYGCTKLGSVNLEEGLTTINQRAFYNCNLTSVTIPSTVTSIGKLSRARLLQSATEHSRVTRSQPLYGNLLLAPSAQVMMLHSTVPVHR